MTKKTKDQKRTEAKERQARWDTMTPTEKLADLERRGHTAIKQRERLTRELDAVVE